MAHELVIIGGKASMAYVGETPWHGLGQVLTPDSSIETWKEEAGFNWDIVKSPITFNTGDNKTKIYTGSKALFRSDTHEQLSIVSDKYHVVQPGEVLDFFQDLVGAAGMKLNTAGVLFGGRRFWALAETGQFGHLNGNDAVKGNLLLTTSCDGTTSTTAQFVATRVVCNNTLRIALNEKGKNVKVNHSRIFNPLEIKNSLGLIDESWNTFMANINKLAEKKITDKKAHDFVYDLVHKPNVSVADQPYTTKQTIDSIMDKFKNGMGNNGKTYWDLLNGITERYQHELGRTRSVDVKLFNNFFGNDALIKDKAYTKLVELASI